MCPFVFSRVVVTIDVGSIYLEILGWFLVILYYDKNELVIRRWYFCFFLTCYASKKFFYEKKLLSKKPQHFSSLNYGKIKNKKYLFKF